MLLELGSEEFFTSWSRLSNFPAAADQISTVSPDSLVVDGESADEDCHLKDEIDHDSETSDEAEILESRYVSE